LLSLSPRWPWVTAALLGAFHGVNPAMGWLFAVALGLQEGRRSAVLAALAPLALGHAISVRLVLLILGAARSPYLQILSGSLPPRRSWRSGSSGSPGPGPSPVVGMRSASAT
jgi:hypothetical protein